MIEKISKFGFGEHKNSFVATTETPGASSSFVILFASAVPITGRFLFPKVNEYSSSFSTFFGLKQQENMAS